jgi:hypothetical protein
MVCMVESRLSQGEAKEVMRPSISVQAAKL